MSLALRNWHARSTGDVLGHVAVALWGTAKDPLASQTVLACRVEANTGGRRENDTLEFFAPEHHQFDGGEHSLICFDADDLRTRAAQSSLTPCPLSCDCYCPEEDI